MKLAEFKAKLRNFEASEDDEPVAEIAGEKGAESPRSTEEKERRIFNRDGVLAVRRKGTSER